MKQRKRFGRICLAVCLVVCVLLTATACGKRNPIASIAKGEFSTIGVEMLTKTEETTGKILNQWTELTGDEKEQFLNGYNSAKIGSANVNREEVFASEEEVKFGGQFRLQNWQFLVTLKSGKQYRVEFAESEKKAGTYYAVLWETGEEEYFFYKVGNPDALKEMPGLEDYFN